jgi:beta-glucanase (GH16 family)
MPMTVITFPSITKTVFGADDQQLIFSQNAGLTTVESTTPTICSIISNFKIRVNNAGICKLTATNSGTSSFKPARPVNRSLLISKGINEITVADFSWLSMANPTADLKSAQTAGTTTFTASPSTRCTISGLKITALKLGTCVIKASNPGNSNYLPAKSVSKSFKIEPTSNVAPPQVNQVGPWTLRQTTFTDANSWSDIGSASTWVKNGWYKTGLTFRVAQLEAMSTTRLTYVLFDSANRPVPNKLVNLSVGKRYAGSNAKVQIGNMSTAGADRNPLDQLLVAGNTNSLGEVSFDVKGLDTQARAGLFVQVAAWVTDMSVDTIDITNLEYSIPSSGGSTGGGNTNPDLVNPNSSIDSLMYQACTGITLAGQIAAMSTDPIDSTKTALAVTRGRPDSPSGIWDYSVLTTLPEGNFISTGSRVVTVEVYSPISGIPMRLRLQNSRTNYSKFIETQAVTTKVRQWETLTFDFNKLVSGSQTIGTGVAYTTLSLIIEPGVASTGQKYFFKNFLFPGALIGKSRLTPASLTPTLSEKPGPTGKYLWTEEFNGVAKSKPNTSAWKYALDWNNFIQGTQPDLVELDGNGNLAIGMQKCDDGTWNGGIIHTWGKVAFLYGKMEARIKIASDPGWFSAFYMFGENVAQWPLCGEFDIQESGPWNDFSSSGTIHGNYANTTTDWNGGGGFSTNVPASRAQLSAGFHTFGLLWTPNSIVFTLDEIPYKTFTKAQVVKDGGTWPFDNPEFVVFSLYPHVASLPSATPAGTLVKGQVLVDWIRYSQFDGYGQVFTR